MNTKNNIKFQETHNKIITSFLSELEKTSIEKITVTTICKKTQINRSTFYAHFEDIYAILKALSDELGSKLYMMFQNSTTKEHSRILEEEDLLKYIEFIYMHRDFYKIYFSSIPFEQMNNGLEKTFSELIYPRLIDRGESDMQTGVYYFTFFKAGLFAVIKHWVLLDCDKTPVEITHIILKGLNVVRRIIFPTYGNFTAD